MPILGICIIVWGFMAAGPAGATVEQLASTLASEMVTFEQALEESNLATTQLPQFSVIEIYAAASVGVGLPFLGGIEVVPEIEMSLERVE